MAVATVVNILLLLLFLMTRYFRNNFQILVLTENQLMIGNYRDEAMSGEGRCVYCWNFVSKDYADNYEAPVVEVYPTLPADWRDYVEPKTNQIITYVLDEKKPFDWCNPDGTLKNVASTAAASKLPVGITKPPPAPVYVRRAAAVRRGRKTAPVPFPWGTGAAVVIRWL